MKRQLFNRTELNLSKKSIVLKRINNNKKQGKFWKDNFNIWYIN